MSHFSTFLHLWLSFSCSNLKKTSRTSLFWAFAHLYMMLLQFWGKLLLKMSSFDLAEVFLERNARLNQGIGVLKINVLLCSDSAGFVGNGRSIFYRDIWDLWSVHNTNACTEVPQDSKPDWICNSVYDRDIMRLSINLSRGVLPHNLRGGRTLWSRMGVQHPYTIWFF